MADNDTMKTIKARTEAMPRDVLAVAETYDALAAALSAAMRTYATALRETAELWTKSRKRGWQSTSTEMRRAAAYADELAAGIDKLDAEPPSAPAQPNPHRAPLRPPFGEPADIAALTEITHGMAASNDEAIRRAGAAFDHAIEGDPTNAPAAFGAASDAMRAYLSGATDTLPADMFPAAMGPPAGTLVEAGVVSGPPLSEPPEGWPAHDAAALAESLGPPSTTTEGEALQPSTGYYGPTDAERAATPTADPFTDPTPYIPQASVPEGGTKLTFVDLLRPADLSQLPAHLSYSQVEMAEDCGLKYRLRYVDRLAQVPQWALVGGTAFHAAVTEVETSHADTGHWSDPAALAVVWNRVLHTTIATTAAEHPTMPMNTWRASKQGKEGYDWWRVEGEHMLLDYVGQRVKLAEAATKAGVTPRQPLALDGVPVRETELTLQVPGPLGTLEVKCVIDAAWICQAPTPPGAAPNVEILVEDLKSGASTPADTFQLGLYAWALAQRLYGPMAAEPASFLHDGPRFMGAYYDARKAVHTPAVNLLERHPWEEVVYRVHAAEANRRSGVYAPRPSSFCGGCPFRYACPVGGR